MKDKLILVDCDGVLFDWEYAFGRWMNKHGYEIVAPGNYLMDVKYGIEKAESKKLIRMFNESAWIRKLPPLRDAIKYVKKLNEEYDYEEMEKYAIAVFHNGYDDVDKVVIHSLTDQGVDFLAKGGNHKKLNKKHVRESVSLEELIDTYNDVNGTDF